MVWFKPRAQSPFVLSVISAARTVGKDLWESRLWPARLESINFEITAACDAKCISDFAAHEWLTRFDLPIAIVATKADKLNRAEQKQAVNALAGAYDTQIVLASAIDGSGLEDMWKLIRGWIS
jgi:hypothetical protein